jgi:hypothetical protein
VLYPRECSEEQGPPHPLSLSASPPIIVLTACLSSSIGQSDLTRARCTGTVHSPTSTTVPILLEVPVAHKVVAIGGCEHRVHVLRGHASGEGDRGGQGAREGRHVAGKTCVCVMRSKIASGTDVSAGFVCCKLVKRVGTFYRSGHDDLA